MMNEILIELKQLLQTHYSEADIDITDYEDFIPEQYPAICLTPQQDVARPGSTFGFDDYLEDATISLHFIQPATENRGKLEHVQDVESLKQHLLSEPQLSGRFNKGIVVQTRYRRRQTEDNIEFVTQLVIEGRNI